MSSSTRGVFVERAAKANASKRNGVHYTPVELARFLAEALVNQLNASTGMIKVLDPACGEGALLAAFSQALPIALRKKCILVGYETDPKVASQATEKLRLTGVAQVIIHVGDFLSQPAARGHLKKDGGGTVAGDFDALITNPPYVRTQVMGSAKARMLAKEFDLTGRVDLYHAFIRASANILKPGGTLGLLTSNRFLTIKSGQATRKLLSSEFSLRHIFDLGDTKLFKAAVLPVIVVAQRLPHSRSENQEVQSNCAFDRVYRFRELQKPLFSVIESPCILETLREPEIKGLIQTHEGLFRVERGELVTSGDESLWSLSTGEYREWLANVVQHQQHSFDDVARIRVGIKTTADEVFLRDKWTSLNKEMQPELELIRPLVRHFDANRWVPNKFSQSVIYPHEDLDGKRSAVNLDQYPRARRYFEHHKQRLTDRPYLIDSGRQWYEIWVPHSPRDWSQPKIVYPDISEEPRFFLDHSGAVVNGDCYWITLREGVDPKMLLLMLAVANSTFMARYYDIVFHNKLYSGRRRYMTQYVKNFPLPDIESKAGREIVAATASLLESKNITAAHEEEIDQLVLKSFGLEQSLSTERQSPDPALP